MPASPAKPKALPGPKEGVVVSTHLEPRLELKLRMKGQDGKLTDEELSIFVSGPTLSDLKNQMENLDEDDFL